MMRLAMTREVEGGSDVPVATSERVEEGWTLESASIASVESVGSEGRVR